jgi:four helix bundle protein
MANGGWSLTAWRMADGEWRKVSTSPHPGRYEPKGGGNVPVQSQTVELLARTKAFSLAAIRFYSTLPRETVAQVLGRQLLRSATSVGAQYREAQRAKSIADFLSKTEGALQEVDEAGYWLELLEDAGIGTDSTSVALRAEARELLAILVAITRTAKSNKLRS